MTLPAGRKIGLPILALAVGVTAAWVWFRGPPWRESDKEQTKSVVEQFTRLVRARDFAGACDLVADAAPPKRSGAGACPSQLRAANARVVGVQLRRVEVSDDGGKNGRLYIAAFEPGGLFDVGPVFHFTFVRDSEAWRIEHVAGFF